MNSIKRARPSPALVVAVMALVAAGGTAVAEVATTARLDKKEEKQIKKIASKQINKLASGLSVAHADTADSANSADSADSANLAANVADNAINSPKVLDNSLKGTDVDESALGPTVRLIYRQRANQCTVAEGAQSPCTATCPEQLNAIGGGIVAEGNHGEQVFIHGSRFNPSSAAGTGWTGFVDNNTDLGGADNNNNVTAYVICLGVLSTQFSPDTG